LAAVATTEAAGTEVARAAILEYDEDSAVRVDAEPRATTRNGPHRLVKPLLVLADVSAVWVAQIIATLVVAADQGWTAHRTSHYLLITALTLPVWPVVFARHKLYGARFVTRFFDEMRRATEAIVVGLMTTVMIAWITGYSLSRLYILVFGIAALVLVGAERYLVRDWFRRRRARGVGLRRVLIIGTNKEAIELRHALRKRELGYEVIGFIGPAETARETLDGLSVYPGIANTVEIAKSIDAGGVVFATSALDMGAVNGMIRSLLDSGLHVELTSGLRDVAPERVTVRPLGRHPAVYLEPPRRHGWRGTFKHLFDFVAAGLVFLVTLPVVAVCAVIVKLTSDGPAFFAQERVGRDAETFKVYKLRTMVSDAEAQLVDLRDRNEADGPLFKMAEDPRVTRFGRVLRKYSIDELPQMWNVLKGDMSLVGPRPALPREVAKWGDEAFDRLRVRPGITGMWQVSGRSDSSFEEYLRLDLYYVDNWSILVDVAILLRTLPAVMSASGAY
jgi:exopolysaccharide biosynthesis polyprenyl glycosylphosphotransferase